MLFPEIISLSAILIFGVISVLFSLKEEKIKRDLVEKDRIQKNRLYEILILKEVQERIGYSLDIEKIVDVITGSLKNFFPYSTASSLIIKGDKLIFKCFLEEGVSHSFVEQVKKTMLASLSENSKVYVPTNTEEIISGAIIDDSNTHIPSSFFHIPLNIDGGVVGLINVSSTKPGLYKEGEMSVLFNITNQASNALSKLQSVLETEKGKLMSMIGSLGDGVFMVGQNNELLVINQAAKDLLSIKKEKPTIFDLFECLPEGFDLATKIDQAITQNKKIEEKGKKMGNKTMEIFITPVEDSKTNKVIGASILLHDVTAEKELSQIKEDFINMMVHELRAPLTSIRQASSLMITESLNEEDKSKFLNIIHNQSKVLLEDVNSLLDAAKIESGKLSLQKTQSDIKRIISDAIDVFEPQAQTKKISLVSHIDDNIPFVLCDEIKISQVLNNLISNSLKYTPEEGRVTIQAVKKNDKEVTLIVADNGVGIPKEKQEQLFLRFSQINYPEQRKYPVLGSGLGLYIAKGIIQAHGGSISLESEVNRGTTISLTLPIYSQEQASEQAQKPQVEPSQTSQIGTVLN